MSDHLADRIAGPDGVIVLDMDGVVLRGYGIDDRLRERAVEAVLLDRDCSVPEADRAALASGEYDVAFRAACERHGLDPVVTFDAIDARIARQALAGIDAGDRRLVTDADALDALAPHGPLALVSNHYDPVVERVVERFELDVFDRACGRSVGLTGHRRAKPDPHYLVETMDTLGVTDGIYVGDREADLIAAERAGLAGVLIRRAHNADVSVSADPALEITSLEDLAANVDRARVRR